MEQLCSVTVTKEDKTITEEWEREKAETKRRAMTYLTSFINDNASGNTRYTVLLHAATSRRGLALVHNVTRNAYEVVTLDFDPWATASRRVVTQLYGPREYAQQYYLDTVLDFFKENLTEK